MLKPSRRTNQLVRYCLAEAARHTGVLIHAICFMSNHWHGVVTDPFARLPEFLERFHRLFARAQNSTLGRWENLWSSDKPSIIALGSDEDVLEKMAYTIANPTAAGLVRSPREWPGVISLRLGERVVVDKPDIAFFAPDGLLPDQVTLEIVRPPIYQHLEDIDLAKHLAHAVERRVREARHALAAQHRNFIGTKAVLRQPFDAIPLSTEPRRNPSPRIAAKHTPERVRAIQDMLDFTPGVPALATRCSRPARTRSESTRASPAHPPAPPSRTSGANNEHTMSGGALFAAEGLLESLRSEPRHQSPGCCFCSGHGILSIGGVARISSYGAHSANT